MIVNPVYTLLDEHVVSKSKNRSKRILFGSILLLVTVVFFIILYFIKQNQENNDNLCLTSYCIEAAETIRMKMNEKVNPCENFYEFACGSWIQNTKLSSIRDYESSTTKMVENMYNIIINVLSSKTNFMQSNAITNARRLYNSCLNEMNFDLTQSFIYQNRFKHDLLDILLKFNQYDFFVFYQIESVFDYKNFQTSKYHIRISPGSIDSNKDDQDIDISQYLLPRHNQDFSADIQTTVKNLSQIIHTSFNFSDYLRRLYLLGNVILNDDDLVNVHNLDRIHQISSILNRYSLNFIEQYLIKHFYRSHTFHFSKRSRLNMTKRSHQIKCAKFVNKYMQFAVSKLYIDQSYDRFAHSESIELINNIQKTFLNMIEQSTWMDLISKKRTIEKTKAIVKKIGYPDYFEEKNLTKLEHMYAEYNFNQSHIHNFLLLLQLNAKQRFRSLRQRSIRYGPTTTNAFYSVSFNEIIVPAAFLQLPMFHPHAPKYLNYGAIGSIIGHELTHAFDDIRRYIDKNRKNFTLWSNQTNELFNQRSKCLIDQYNNYRISQINRQVNGTRTLNENIADNDGLKKAFYAYKNWIRIREIHEKKLPNLNKYTNEQMFFISFAQSRCSKMSNKFAHFMISSEIHSPSEFRVKGSTSNFLEFDRIFQCQPGQENSRVQKCNTWE